MNIDPNYLPAIPTAVRQWIYLLFLIGIFVLFGIDAFWERPEDDPWWLPGALRVKDVVEVGIMAIVLAHTRKTVAEQIRQAEKNGEPLPAAFSAVPESRAVPLGDRGLGHPEHLTVRPVTERDPDHAP